MVKITTARRTALVTVFACGLLVPSFAGPGTMDPAGTTWDLTGTCDLKVRRVWDDWKPGKKVWRDTVPDAMTVDFFNGGGFIAKSPTDQEYAGTYERHGRRRFDTYFDQRAYAPFVAKIESWLENSVAVSEGTAPDIDVTIVHANAKSSFDKHGAHPRLTVKIDFLTTCPATGVTKRGKMKAKLSSAD
jgi:hypothetical protein